MKTQQFNSIPDLLMPCLLLLLLSLLMRDGILNLGFPNLDLIGRYANGPLSSRGRSGLGTSDISLFMCIPLSTICFFLQDYS